MSTLFYGPALCATMSRSGGTSCYSAARRICRSGNLSRCAVLYKDLRVALLPPPTEQANPASEWLLCSDDCSKNALAYFLSLQSNGNKKDVRVWTSFRVAVIYP